MCFLSVRRLLILYNTFSLRYQFSLRSISAERMAAFVIWTGLIGVYESVKKYGCITCGFVVTEVIWPPNLTRSYNETEIGSTYE